MVLVVVLVVVDVVVLVVLVVDVVVLVAFKKIYISIFQFSISIKLIK